jgi:MFS family permease
MRWYVVALFAVLYVLSFVDRLVLTLLIEPLKADLGITDVQVGLLIGTAFALLYAVLGLPVAWLVDHGNRTRIAAAGILIWSASTIASGFATSFAELLPLRMGLALGEAVLSPVYVSLVVDHFRRSERALPMVIFGASGVSGVMAAYALGGGIIDLFQHGAFAGWPVIGDLPIWRATLVLVGIPGIVLAALLLGTTRDPARVRDEPSADDADAFEGGIFISLREVTRFYLPFFGGNALLEMMIYGVLAWYPTHLVRAFGVPISESGYLFSVSLTLGAIITLLFPAIVKLMTRFGRADILVPLQLVVIPIGAIIFGFALLERSVGAATLLTIAGMGLLFGISTLPSIVTGMTAPPRYSARILATNVAFQNVIGLALGPPFVALIARGLEGWDRPLGTAILVLTMLTLPVCWLLVLSSWRPYRIALNRAGDRAGGGRVDA